MSKRTCEHIQDDGLRCTNPAMYRREVCFQHWRQLRPNVPPSDPAYVPSFDSEASISNASAHMFRSVLAGKVDLKQARLALQYLRETARSMRRQRKIGDKSEIHFTSFMADYYSALDSIQAKSAAAYPDPQPLIYPAYFRDIPEHYDDDAEMNDVDNNVGTGALARATRAQFTVLPADTSTHDENELLDAARPRAASPAADSRDSAATSPVPVGKNSAAAAAPEDSPWREPWVSVTSNRKAPEEATDKPLSPTQTKLLKKILRRGPKHPQFARAARLLDHHIAGSR